MFNIFTKLSRQLYPTGRAWRLKIDTLFFKLHDALAKSEKECYDASDILYTSILPDNNNFSNIDATNWERALGLLNQPYLTLSERKQIILRKMQHPGNISARQHYLYLQSQLQNAGFDVYVHENRPIAINPESSYYNSFNYGGQVYGNNGILNSTKIVNYIDEIKDQNFIFGNEQHLRALFFIGAQTYPNFANIPQNRKREFRELILKLKPAQSGGILLINYT